MLAGLDAEDPSAAPFLQGGWVRAHYHARQAAPACILRWLFEIACYHRCAALSAAAARALSSLFADSDGAPAWAPMPSDFVQVLERHGAVLDELLPPKHGRTVPCPPTDAATQGQSSEQQQSEGTDGGADDPRQCLLAALELLPSCARWWGTDGAHRVAVDDQLSAVRWMLRPMLEPHCAPAFTLILSLTLTVT